MPKVLDAHKVGPRNAEIQVLATDQPGAGGAHREYAVNLKNGMGFSVRFHDGNDADINGEIGTTNGATHEAYLAIIADRLEGFQQGSYPCDENAEALSYVQAAIAVLHKRTEDRISRGVHGKREK